MSRDNKVQVKNQQRRLEGKSYTPARAYLNKEKCKKHLPLLDTKVEEWKEKLEVVKVEEESKRFDAEKILEQIEKVHDVIGSIQIQKNPNNQPKIPKARSTELGKASKPNIEELSIADKLRGKEFLEKNSFKEGKRKSIGTIQQDKNGMVRIRSSRNVLKVYNPFPASFAEMVQQFD